MSVSLNFNSLFLNDSRDRHFIQFGSEAYAAGPWEEIEIMNITFPPGSEGAFEWYLTVKHNVNTLRISVETMVGNGTFNSVTDFSKYDYYINISAPWHASYGTGYYSADYTISSGMSNFYRNTNTWLIKGYTCKLYKRVKNLSPVVVISLPLQNSVFSGIDTSFTPRISVSDVDSDSLTCKYYIDSETTPRDTKTALNTKTVQSVTFNPVNIGALTEGNHTMKFEVSDESAVPVISTINFKVDKTAPTAPTSLAISNKTDSSVTLAWKAATDNVGVAGYDICNGSIPILTVTGTSYTVAGLAANVTYNFTVKARDIAGNLSVASNSVQVTTDNLLGNTDNLAIKVQNIKSFVGRTFTVTYNASHISSIDDLCAITPTKETTTGAIANTGITITQFTPGTIKFTVNKSVESGKTWSGVVNAITFKPAISGQVVFTCTIQ